jgi:hypothetical protein
VVWVKLVKTYKEKAAERRISTTAINDGYIFHRCLHESARTADTLTTRRTSDPLQAPNKKAQRASRGWKMTVRKGSRTSGATKRKASQNSVSKSRSKKETRGKRKTDFKAAAWYAVAAQSIAIVASVEP